jgi:organic radical activating enzyme
LRQLADARGDALVQGVLRIVEEQHPLHLSLVGGDPLVRYRELELLLPELEHRGVYVQLVTSAFRPIPQAWSWLPRLKIVVSIDGLAPEHDQRRGPATYERILKNVAGGRMTIHCTITSQMVVRPTYLQEFLDFWSPRSEVAAVWFSLFTPQKGARDPEILDSRQRVFVVSELLRLAQLYPKLDMKAETIREFLSPPQSPQHCVFAGVTETVSADLRTRITPCQFGGNPDCSQCGCLASMAFSALGERRVLMGIRAGSILKLSRAIGSARRRLRLSALRQAA